MSDTKVKNGILEGVIWKQLLLFFFPIMIGSFFQQLYNTADALILGRAVGKEALAAVGGSAALISSLVVNFFMGLTSGAAIITSQMLGAGNKERLNDAIHTIYAFSIIGSVAFAVVGIVASPMLLTWMNTAPELMQDSIVYLQIYFGGSIFIFIYNTGSSILRALGDSKRPLYYLIACCVINIVLDILMVAVFDLGVAGVAIATVAAQAVSAILVTQALMREKELCDFSLRKIRMNAELLKEELFLGFPTGIQASMYNISNMLVQSSINSFGTDTTAAWAAYGKLDAIFWMMSGALGIAITTFVGQNYGAGKIDRVKKSVKVGLFMDIGIAVVMGVLLIVARVPLFGIFCEDAAVVEIGAHMLFVLTPFYCVYVFTEIYSGALRGLGDVVVPMLITMFGVCGVRTLWIAIVAGAFPTLDVVIFNYPVTWVISGVAFIIYYKYKIKKVEALFTR
ncbi:MAG: MATE family efflux transporter [Roseburia sp.]|nr:MATE family efflux transporter [Roseburia sp.]